MNKIKIESTFKNLIPPLTEEEFLGLEKNILAENKIRDPLVLWNGILIDGHNRYKIAKKHGLNYKTENMNFKDEEEVKIWIIDNQLGRRNLPPYVRIELAKMKEPAIKAEAEKRMLAGKADRAQIADIVDNVHNAEQPYEADNAGKINPVQKSAQGDNQHITDRPDKTEVSQIGKTRDKLAAIAGVSHDTYKKATEIMEVAPPDVIQELREGKAKINTVYNEVVKPHKLSVAEMALGGVKRRKEPRTAEYRQDLQQIKESAKEGIDNAQDHKQTITEFQDMFRANAKMVIATLKYVVDCGSDSHLWDDEEHIQIAFDVIDEVIGAIADIKKGIRPRNQRGGD